MVRQFDPPAIIEFGNFRILPHRRQLLADGQPIALGGRAFDVLMALIEASGAIVSKDELLRVVWQGRIVEENRLAGQIVALRKAFGADRELIRTVAGRGYQFTGEVRVRSEGERRAPGTVTAAAEAPHAAESDRASLPLPDKPSIAVASSPLRPRLSIVILPFLNLSQDPSEDYFVDGICDSLITDLSRALPGSFVISRSTAFAYKGRQVAIRQVGQELGVRYVLEGSMLASARHVRVNAQLIDAVTDEHLWAERFDKERKDILEVQDEIVARLSRSVGIEMVRSAATRGNSGSSSGDVIDLVMRARSLANDIKRRENAASAVELFRKALDLDPDNVDALVGLATLCSYQVVNLYRLDGRDALLEEAEVLLSRAAALAPEHTGMLKARALLHRAQGRFAEAITATATVIARNPGEPTSYKEMGLNKLYIGEAEEAVEWFRRADAIAPADPDRWTWLQGLGRALMQLGRDAEAVDALSQSMDNNPGHLRGKAWLAAAEALSGDDANARRHLAEYIAAEPEMTVERFAGERSSVPLDVVSPVYRREIERILDGLRRAGMPASLAVPPPPRPMTNLSESISELIGREAALSEVTDLVTTHRLVTLTGEGGIGKTRLGLQVARQLLPEFADGVWVTELAPLADPALVPVSVATALGLELTGGAISPERVANMLGAKRLLLVLDNCEHVVAAATEIAETLLRCNSTMRVLATSREPLRAEGECLYRVPPLAVPAQGIEDVEEVLRHGAVRLFVARARATDPHFCPDGPSAAAAAAICRRLDGIPLAIELAAARGAALGIAEIAAWLDDRFHLLTSGHRMALPRHQTLRATLDWSYELLPEPERVALLRLAIFAGGFTLAAASAVVTDTNTAASDVVHHLANLVAKSLVVADTGGSLTRYRLLDTTRAYALEKLAQNGELDAVASCHAEFYRDLFERAETEWETRPTAEWLADYGWRLDNLRAALDWAFSPGGDLSVGVALTAAAVPLWMHLSLMEECGGRVERALAAMEAGTSPDARREMKLHAALAGSLIYTKAEAAEIGAAWTKALELAESLDDVEYQLRALRGLQFFHVASNRYRVALEVAEKFHSLAANRSDPNDRLIGERMIAVSQHYFGDQRSARRHIDRALADGLAPNRRSHIVRFQVDQGIAARVFLGRILWLQGFPEQAMRTAESSVEDARAANHAISLCYTLAYAACPIAFWVGDLAAAEHYAGMLLDHSTRHGLVLWHALGRSHRGVLVIKRGDAIAGLGLLRAGRDEFGKERFAERSLIFLTETAEALGRAGEIADGLAVVEEAIAACEQTEGRFVFAELLRVKGELFLLQGAPGAAAAAEDHFGQALDWSRRQGALSWELRAATSLARLWGEPGRRTEAHELLAPVYGWFTEGFDTADLKEAKALLAELA